MRTGASESLRPASTIRVEAPASETAEALPRRGAPHRAFVQGFWNRSLRATQATFSGPVAKPSSNLRRTPSADWSRQRLCGDDRGPCLAQFRATRGAKATGVDWVEQAVRAAR